MQPPYSPYPYASSPQSLDPHAPPPPRSGWPPAARWAVGCGSCCGLLVLLEVAVIWFALQVGVGMRPPEGLKASVTSPSKVTAGRTFPLTLVIRNAGTSSFSITNLSVRSSTLQRLQLSNPQPAPASATFVWGTQVWGYRKSLEPGEKWTVRFEATAAEAGEVHGALEVQAGLPTQRVPFTVKVEPSATGQPAKPRRSSSPDRRTPASAP